MLNIFVLLSISSLIFSTNLFSKSYLYKNKNSVINYQNNEKPNFCVDCKFYIPNDFLFGIIGKEFGKCKLYYDIKDDDRDFLVTGIKKNVIKEYKYCSICRDNDNMCGKQGIQFINKK
jgi:hypothetical protein